MKKLFMGRAIISVLTAAVLCVQPLTAMAAAVPPAYLKSATYFSDDWPINFWSSESRNMDSEMAQIVADGFNSIILIIPWREFQPDISHPSTLNPYATDKLDRIMETAKRHGIWITVRLGYTWDYYESQSPLYRYEDLLSDSNTKAAWLTYAKTMYTKLSSYDNFYGGFITWEDFWNFPENSLGISREEGKKKASTCGYTAYLQKHYSLQELSQWYQENITSYNQIYIPNRQQPAAKLFYEFYDVFLNKLLKDTQTVFPDLSMEVRLDRELLTDLEGNTYYYGHEATYACGSAPYTTAMTSVAMGQRNENELIDAASGIYALTNHLKSSMEYTQGKKFYIGQFLYMDTTAEFSYNAQILPEQVPAYITGMAPAFRQYTTGYGVWVYRDYGNNQLYNPQFALGSMGWSCERGIKSAEYDGTPMMLLQPGLTLRQNLRGSMRNRSQTDATVSFRAVVDTPCKLDIYLGLKKKTVEISGDSAYTVEFQDVSAGNITFQSDGIMYLDDVNLYNFVQQARLYDIQGNPEDCIDAVRKLNAALK